MAKDPQTPRTHRWQMLLVLALLPLWFLLWHALVPRITEGVLVENGVASPVRLPLHRDTGSGHLDITASFTAGPLRPSYYVLTVDDCVERITVNGQAFTHPLLPFCNGPGMRLDLGPVLQTGHNVLTAAIRDHGGIAVFGVRASASDPLVAAVLALLILITGAAALVALRTSTGKYAWVLPLILTAGIALRVVYLNGTPHNVRSYDWDGHIEYIQYIADYAAIPPAQGGWEFYQPPLYYFLTGGWTIATREMLGTGTTVAMDDMRAISLLISLAALLAALLVFLRVFPREEDRQSLWLSAGLIAVFPGVVFFTSRITNDTLFLLLGILWFLALLRWWHSARDSDWCVMCITLSLCLLTKSNGLPFIPIAGACLLLHPGMHWRRKLLQIGEAVGILSVLTGWFFVLRFIVEKETFIVGNRLNGSLGVQNTWVHLLQFNPFNILAHPYNDNWNDLHGRQYFWEYLFKSFFVGEWNFGKDLRPLTLLMELLGLATLPLVAMGFLKSAREWKIHLPMIATLLLLLLAGFAYRVRSPFSANQDFRFIPVIILPIIVFAVRGRNSLQGVMRHLATGILLAFAVCCLLFTLLVLRA